jgi:hypothetical protein
VPPRDGRRHVLTYTAGRGGRFSLPTRR